MALFSNLKSDGLEEAQDRLGGFQLFDTDIYTGTIKTAYAGQSEGGAQSINLIMDFDGKEYRETLWITNKKGENWFVNKDDPKKKVPLPGFVIIDDICQVTVGKPLSDMGHEEKLVKVYDPDQKKELPKAVPVLTELVGQTVSLGIVKALENKNAKNGAGEYEPTADTRETNFIDKVFHTETQMTVVEAKRGADKAAFWPSWVERNKGQVRDRRKIKDGATGAAGAAGRPGRPVGGPPMANGAAGGAAPARKSLFGNKPA